MGCGTSEPLGSGAAHTVASVPGAASVSLSEEQAARPGVRAAHVPAVAVPAMAEPAVAVRAAVRAAEIRVAGAVLAWSGLGLVAQLVRAHA